MLELSEAHQAGFDLAVRAELIADLGGQLGQLVSDVMQAQRAQLHQHAAVFEHRFDLRHQRVVHLQRLHRAE